MRRIARRATFGATLLVALAYASAFIPGGERWGVWCMVVGLAVMIVALMLLGAVREPARDPAGATRAPAADAPAADALAGRAPSASARRLTVPLGLTFLLLLGGFGAVLLLPAEGADAPLFLGLPLRAAIVLYGVGLVPLLVLPLAFALTFDEVTLRADDLARLRELAAQRARAGGGEEA